MCACRVMLDAGGTEANVVDNVGTREHGGMDGTGMDFEVSADESGAAAFSRGDLLYLRWTCLDAAQDSARASGLDARFSQRVRYDRYRGWRRRGAAERAPPPAGVMCT